MVTSPINLTFAFVSASIPVISMPLAALFVGVLMDTFGRKRVIQLAFIPLILGWALISQSESIRMIYLGRFMTGFAIGKIVIFKFLKFIFLGRAI